MSDCPECKRCKSGLYPTCKQFCRLHKMVVAEIYDLKDKLAEKTEVADHWFNECKKRIPTCPLNFEETVHALANMDMPRCSIK